MQQTKRDVGKIYEIDYEKYKARVLLVGNSEPTDFLPFRHNIGTEKNQFIFWPDIDQIVVVETSFGRDFSQGWILGGAFHTNLLLKEHEYGFVWPHGEGDDQELDIIVYNKEERSLRVAIGGDLQADVGGKTDVTSEGHITVNAKSGATINGDVQINGNLGVSKEVTAVTDGRGVQLSTHTHPHNHGHPDAGFISGSTSQPN